MTRIDGGEEYQLSSGRVFDANAGFIGLAFNPTTGSFEVTEGYDAHIDVDGIRDFPEGWIRMPWTAEEKRELAEFMVRQWQAFGGIE